MAENPYHSLRNQYAQGAIRAVSLVNGAAAVAMLSQLEAFERLGLSEQVTWALGFYLAGIVLGVIVWALGFRSTAYGAFAFDSKAEADKINEYAIHGRADKDRWLKHTLGLNRVANVWGNLGAGILAFALACFVAGSVIVLFAYAQTLAGATP